MACITVGLLQRLPTLQQRLADLPPAASRVASHSHSFIQGTHSATYTSKVQQPYIMFLYIIVFCCQG